LIEIYTPIKSTEKQVFYEFGSLMPILEDSDGVMVHGGLDTNQDTVLGTNASGVFDWGDVYHILRTPSKPLDLANATQYVFHESEWYF